ncbi:MAG: triose-phosphate isomerase [Micavibrio sp.]|nr:triose-phosphate isomerase [Micavibrio sp.]
MSATKSAQKLIVGNWKMNGLLADGEARTEELVEAIKARKSFLFDMVLCPPATLIGVLTSLGGSSLVKWGGQDCHAKESGAFTGDISAAMLQDLGCTYVILGHSERRQNHKESSATVQEKAKAAHAAGLIAIICVGETDAERTAGKANDIVSEQLAASIPAGATAANTVVAYEPVWAIGTGKTASADDILNMHQHIRGKVGDLAILYGGSVKGSNAAEILKTPNVDGVLVGGASLKVEEFLTIATAA